MPRQNRDTVADVVAEVAACELVRANRHRVRTVTRVGRSIHDALAANW